LKINGMNPGADKGHGDDIDEGQRSGNSNEDISGGGRADEKYREGS
jgi:hypothetical protein